MKAVLESVGIEADSDRLDTLISELNGKDINGVRAKIPSVRCETVRLVLTCV
jgi:ribosomal protein L12E/L44/L45/RPP1/RPP2